MALAETRVPAAAPRQAAAPLEITVFGHSKLFYWWPVWVVGYALALATYLDGIWVHFVDRSGAQTEVLIHPSRSLGVIFTFTVILIMVLTNVTLRGGASLTVIIAALAIISFFAYMRWWEDIFEWVSFLAMYMNLGFYIFFATAVLLVWLLAVFVFDRADYYTFRPGQVIHKGVLGDGQRTFSTMGMSVYKLRSDLFRHWILGLGSGDLHIATHGAAAQEIVIQNVLFIGRKLGLIEKLVAMQPDENEAVVNPTANPA